jgi:hypothetical protein
VAAQAEVGTCGVTCPDCEGPIELPEPGMFAYCPGCDAFFRKAEDQGWFTYVVEIYVPMVNGES